MRPTPLVSVIVPAYQAQETLGAALSGALTQTYPRVEVVVCNDGSTDATDAIASAYGDLVRVVRQPNGGLPSARNAAIRAARGDLIALLDADDLWFPPHVQAAVQMLGRIPDGRGIVSCNSYYLTPYGTNPRRTVFARGYPIPADEQRMRILEGNFVSIPTLFPGALWDDLGGFDESMRSLEDYDFWARAIFAGWRVHFQMHPHAMYRRSARSLSQDLPTMQEYERRLLRKLAEEYEGRLTAEESAMLRRRIASEPPGYYVAHGERALEAGDTDRAAQSFARAAELWPSNRRLRAKAAILRHAPHGTSSLIKARQNLRRRES